MLSHIKSLHNGLVNRFHNLVLDKFIKSSARGGFSVLDPTDFGTAKQAYLYGTGLKTYRLLNFYMRPTAAVASAAGGAVSGLMSYVSKITSRTEVTPREVTETVVVPATEQRVEQVKVGEHVVGERVFQVAEPRVNILFSGHQPNEPYERTETVLPTEITGMVRTPKERCFFPPCEHHDILLVKQMPDWFERDPAFVPKGYPAGIDVIYVRQNTVLDSSGQLIISIRPGVSNDTSKIITTGENFVTVKDGTKLYADTFKVPRTNFFAGEELPDGTVSTSGETVLVSQIIAISPGYELPRGQSLDSMLDAVTEPQLRRRLSPHTLTELHPKQVNYAADSYELVDHKEPIVEPVYEARTVDAVPEHIETRTYTVEQHATSLTEHFQFMPLRFALGVGAIAGAAAYFAWGKLCERYMASPQFRADLEARLSHVVPPSLS